MAYLQEFPYITPKTKDFIEDILLHSISFKIDRMEDNSWRRANSDHSLKWVYDNIDKITLNILTVIKHNYENMTEKWNASKHLEFIWELREKTATYIVTAELDYKYLDYFIEKYKLNNQESPNS